MDRLRARPGVIHPAAPDGGTLLAALRCGGDQPVNLGMGEKSAGSGTGPNGRAPPLRRRKAGF